MATVDPISDLLTRIRNAHKAKHRRVDVPASKMKTAIARVLLDQKYIANYTVLEDQKQGILRINLKYHDGRPRSARLRVVIEPRN